MPWAGFATWSAVLLDAVIHGVEFGLALGGIAIIISYGVGLLIGLYRAASQ